MEKTGVGRRTKENRGVITRSVEKSSVSSEGLSRFMQKLLAVQSPGGTEEVEHKESESTKLNFCLHFIFFSQHS